MRSAIVAITLLAVMSGFGSVCLSLEDEPGRGFAPPPFEDHAITANQPMHPVQLPLRFDWRESGCVTSVKNQGTCGACYAFAGLGDFESKLLMAGEGYYDFSENNLKECEWFGRNGLSPSRCEGGTYWRVINLMAEKGTVQEACDPYVPYNSTCKTGCDYIKTVLDWRVICLGEVPPTELLKTYIMNDGPIFVAIDGGIRSAWRNELNDYDGSYTLYYDNSYSVNHAVLIVGWDDTLSHAGGQGAWIAKNSWGTGWGGTAGYGTERGYFTIAYGSANIGWYSSYIKNWKDFDPCDRLLFYDEAGYYGQTGYGVKTAWAMCRFEAPEAAELRRVEFWTTDATSDVDIYVYDDFNGSTLSNLITTVVDTSFTEMGYHSIPLVSPLALNEAQDFYVAVKIANASFVYPLTYDPVGPRAPGRCYMSANGSVWTEFLDGDLGVRARVHLNRDCQPPDRVSSLDASADRTRIVVRWTNPADADFSHTALRFSTSRYPMSVEDGLGIDNGAGGLFYNAPASPDSFVHTGLPREATYYYSAFAADTVFNYSSAASVSATTEGWTSREVKLTDGDRRVVDTDLEINILSSSRAGAILEINLSSAQGKSVAIDIYDVTGRHIRTLGNLSEESGLARILWDGTGDDSCPEPPGVYFIRIEAGDEVATKKVVLIR